MEIKVKNNVVLSLVHYVIKGNYGVKNHINVMSGGNPSAYDYFETLSELASLGHVTDVFMGMTNDPNTSPVKVIDFIPLDSLKDFANKGGFTN